MLQEGGEVIELRALHVGHDDPCGGLLLPAVSVGGDLSCRSCRSLSCRGQKRNIRPQGWVKVGGLRAQDVDCSLQSVGGVVDRPLEGPGRGGGGVPHVQIVAVAGNCRLGEEE